MNVLTKPLSVLVQLVLVLSFMVSSGEATIWTLQKTVDDGTSVKVDDAPPTDPDSFPGLNSFSVDGVERVFQQWFWYRVGPAGGELSLDKLPQKVATTKPTPTSLLITYTLADQFDISVNYELKQAVAGDGKASLEKTVTIKNIAATDLDFHLFEYSDFDLSNAGLIAGENDNIEVFNNKVYQNGPQNDSRVGVTLVHETTLPPGKFDIDNNQISLLPEMEDAAPSDLFSPQTPYRYGEDLQFGQQWDLPIKKGETVIFSISDSFYPTLPVNASKAHAGTCVTYQGKVDYTINFDNLANSALTTENLTNFKVIDILPNNTTPTINPPADGSVYDSNANTVTWSLPTLAAGAVLQTKVLSIIANSAADFTNKLLLVSDQAFPTRFTDPAMLCNHPPAMNYIPNAAINDGGAFRTQVMAYDPDSGPLVYALSGAPTDMAISADGIINYPVGIAGTYVVTVTATDAGSLSASTTFTLTVAVVNQTNVVKVSGNPKPGFKTLQEAYGDTGTTNGMTIQAQAAVFASFTMNRDIDVTIKGGYDTNFQTNSGVSKIQGPLTIQKGSAVVENLTIM